MITSKILSTVGLVVLLILIVGAPAGAVDAKPAEVKWTRSAPAQSAAVIAYRKGAFATWCHLGDFGRRQFLTVKGNVGLSVDYRSRVHALACMPFAASARRQSYWHGYARTEFFERRDAQGDVVWHRNLGQNTRPFSHNVIGSSRFWFIDGGTLPSTVRAVNVKTGELTNAIPTRSTVYVTLEPFGDGFVVIDRPEQSGPSASWYSYRGEPLGTSALPYEPERHTYVEVSETGTIFSALCGESTMQLGRITRSSELAVQVARPNSLCWLERMLATPDGGVIIQVRGDRSGTTFTKYDASLRVEWTRNLDLPKKARLRRDLTMMEIDKRGTLVVVGKYVRNCPTRELGCRTGFVRLIDRAGDNLGPLLTLPRRREATSWGINVESASFHRGRLFVTQPSLYRSFVMAIDVPGLAYRYSRGPYFR